MTYIPSFSRQTPLASIHPSQRAPTPWRSLSLLVGATLLHSGLSWSQALPVASPESVGMSTQRLEKISAAMQAEIEQKRLPGAVVMVARKGKLVYSKAFGGLNNDTNAPAQTDSVFRIYSMTKPMVSVALMMLVEDGKVQLTDPVSKYLPSFKQPMVSVATHDPLYNGVSFKLVPAHKEPTLQDLLRHTSGLAYGELTKNTLVKQAYTEAGIYSTARDFDARNLSGADMAERLGKAPLAQQPGTVWEYSLSVDVQGRIIEAVTGQRLNDFMQQRLFKPLKMNDTAFDVPAAKKARLAEPFAIDPLTSLPNKCQHRARLLAFLPGPVEWRSVGRRAHSVALYGAIDDRRPLGSHHRHACESRTTAVGCARLHLRVGLFGAPSRWHCRCPWQRR